MTDARTSMSPVNRLLCTVDGCDWHHDESFDPGPIEQWPHIPAVDLNDYIGQVVKLHYQETEAALAAHLATHEPIDYLRTIQRLSNRVAELEAEQS